MIKPDQPISSSNMGSNNQSGPLDRTTGTEVKPRSSKLSEYLNELRDYKYFHKSWLMGAETENVKQGQVLASKNQLTTSGLGSCCAVAFQHKGKNFLSHVDAKTSPDMIKQVIEQNFNLDEMKSDPDLKICFWQGCMGMTNHAEDITGQALVDLGLIDKLIFVGNVESHMKTVGINQRGTFEDTTKSSQVYARNIFHASFVNPSN